MKPVGLYWRTIRHLTLRQLAFQVWHRIRGRPRLRITNYAPDAYCLTVDLADKPVSWQNHTFTFLNTSVTFSESIDWNYSTAGKLWTYNLNYFDFLNQPGMSVPDGLALVYSFIDKTNTLHDGLEAYPTSLRITNWIQFLSRNQLNNPVVQAHLWAQVQVLRRRVEYQLMGNHLLENGLALFVAALFFRQKKMRAWAFQLLRKELTKQILADGCHAERSPMYHAILLDRLLTVVFMLKSDLWQYDAEQVAFLTHTAQQMMNWLIAHTFSNGELPMVNDAAPELGPTTTHLRAKMRRTGISECATRQPEPTKSGYRLLRELRYELFVDVGAVGPDYQPGHAHADTLSFLLNVDNQPVFVDMGISTYELGNRRLYERSTAAHNTVEVGGENSSEVWAAFRVGRRARVNRQTDSSTTLVATHNGYVNTLNVLHERSWRLFPDRLVITDCLKPAGTKRQSVHSGVARFHLHPTLAAQLNAPNEVNAGPARLICSSPELFRVSVINYQFAKGFNRLQPAQCVEVTFENYLQTTILIAP